ncbi:hypothetical protein [Thermococcus sp. Bubb.Bath]|uniref:hypothetical protein n=1 Tax=Thermococcus sp. Bubb.Bath TaxID=1638242 RepID=UPI00143A6962|nr:hypothetical protein [Thermococcus sp. Bubb.Bath]NJF25936.1 hypothetical protein [Thermococcus sp. Bubb.Bath]
MKVDAIAIIGIITMLLSLAIPGSAGALLFTLILGYGLSRLIFLENEKALLSAPVFGMATVVFSSYLLSLVGVSLNYLGLSLVVIGVILFLLTPQSTEWEFDPPMWGVLSLSVFLQFLIRRFYFLLPDYRAADTWFHASKVRMILDSHSLYFSNVPQYFPRSIVSYPSGYHAFIAWLSRGDPWNIIFAMNDLRLFEIAYLPLGTYLLARSLAGKRAAVFAALVVPFSALYYYFVQYALLPAFTNYMLFLVASFVYVEAFLKKERRLIWASAFLASLVLLVHPYQYMVFEAFAFFLLLREGFTRDNLRIFTIQLAVSALLYYILTPGASSYASRGAVMNPVYPNKDNLNFLRFILTYTFVNHGQFFLAAGFVLALILSLARWNRSAPLSLTFLFMILVILDKIFLRIPIPYYSAIWNSERAFLLLTPIIPILEGIGIYEIVSWVSSAVSRYPIKFAGRVKVLVAFSLVLIFVAPAVVPLSIEHMASESSYLLDSDVLSSIHWISSHLGNQTVATACVFDSGRWLPILTDTPIVCVANNKGLKASEYRALLNGTLTRWAYLDTRGAAEIEPYPLNVEDFYNRFRLVYFKDGIWLFDVRNHNTSGNINLVKSYFMVNDSIDISRGRGALRYFVYGWVIKNSAAQRILLEGVPYVATVTGNATIAFVPKRDYSALKVLLSAPASGVDFYINGEYAGSFKPVKDYVPQWVTVNGRVLGGKLNFLTIRTHLEGGEALGVCCVKLEGTGDGS